MRAIVNHERSNGSSLAVSRSNTAMWRRGHNGLFEMAADLDKAVIINLPFPPYTAFK